MCRLGDGQVFGVQISASFIPKVVFQKEESGGGASGRPGSGLSDHSVIVCDISD